jgi:ferredoxin
MTEITLRVNGQNQKVAVDDPNMPLLYALRDDLGLRGPKFGCGLGQCGACCVIIDGEVARSCVTLAMSDSPRLGPVRANSDRSLDRRRTGSIKPEAVVHHVNLSCSLDMVHSESFSIRIGRSRVEVSTIEDAVRFIQEWTSAPRSRRSSIGKRMPVAAVRAAALTHPDSLMRRSCLFFLDHYDCDGSVETFRLALSDPVSFVRESALHGIACERCCRRLSREPRKPTSIRPYASSLAT